MSAPSNVFTRYAMPLGIAWTGLLISAYVYSRVSSDGTQIDPAKGLVTFLGVPVISFAGFVMLRYARRRIGAEAGRGEDLVVSWVMTFLLGMHCVVLGLALRLINSLQHALPLAIGLLFVGLGPVLGALEHGSAMGIRTRATLASAEAWRKTHRLIAFAFPIAGIAGFSGLWLSGWQSLLMTMGPPVIALAVVIGYAETRRAVPDAAPDFVPDGAPVSPADEQPDARERRTDDGEA